jgi:hypothetical protein
MEEHFNENYLESDKFPKASFKGTIADIKTVNFTRTDLTTLLYLVISPSITSRRRLLRMAHHDKIG